MDSMMSYKQSLTYTVGSCEVYVCRCTDRALPAFGGWGFLRFGISLLLVLFCIYSRMHPLSAVEGIYLVL